MRVAAGWSGPYERLVALQKKGLVGNLDELDFCERLRNWRMALSFLYLAFVRTLQLVRLGRSDASELAIEVRRAQARGLGSSAPGCSSGAPAT